MKTVCILCIFHAVNMLTFGMQTRAVANIHFLFTSVL